MKLMKTAVLALGVLLCFSAVPVLAADDTTSGGIWDACNGNTAPGTGSDAICGDKREAKDIVKQLIDVFLYAIGILSVIMIVFSGLKYVNSRGDAESVKSAKNTLLYAVVGLVVAMLAFTIVNFVVGRF